MTDWMLRVTVLGLGSWDNRRIYGMSRMTIVIDNRNTTKVVLNVRNWNLTARNMGLMKILKKLKQSEKEIRILLLWVYWELTMVIEFVKLLNMKHGHQQGTGQCGKNNHNVEILWQGYQHHRAHARLQHRNARIPRVWFRIFVSSWITIQISETRIVLILSAKICYLS